MLLERSVSPYISIIFVLVMSVVVLMLKLGVYSKKERINDNSKLRITDTKAYHSVMGFVYNSGACISYMWIAFFSIIYGVALCALSLFASRTSTSPETKRSASISAVIGVYSILVGVVIHMIPWNSAVRRKIEAYKRMELWIANHLDPLFMRRLAQQVDGSEGDTVLIDVAIKRALNISCREYSDGFLKVKKTEERMEMFRERIATSMFSANYISSVANNMSTAKKEYAAMVRELIIGSRTNFAAFNRFMDTSKYTRYLNPNDTLSGVAFDDSCIPSDAMETKDVILVKELLMTYTLNYDRSLNGIVDGTVPQSIWVFVMVIYIPLVSIIAYLSYKLVRIVRNKINDYR